VDDTMSAIDSADAITRREVLRRVGILLGGVISGPTLAGVLAGCSRSDRSAAAAMKALSADQNELVATIAEYIIPRTDTPGARDVGVDQFIDVMLAEYYPRDERDRFLAGLAQVDARSEKEFGKRFVQATPAQQVGLLEALDREAFPKRDTRSPPRPERDVRERTDAPGSESPLPPELESDTIRWNRPSAPTREERTEVPFFRTMKELTLVGYYTSEPGATKELRHEPVPGRFQGCIPFSQVGRTWAV
jgi:gluconate 2-dehydrogenase gamma chain